MPLALSQVSTRLEIRQITRRASFEARRIRLELKLAGVVADNLDIRGGSTTHEIDNAGGVLRFFRPNDVDMVIDSSGNVGIGATTPYALLSVGNGEPGAGKLAVFSPDNVYGQIQIGNSGSNGEASIGFFQGAKATSDGLTGTAWAAGIGSYGMQAGLSWEFR
ncbi:MAG: hypothetical protein WCC90_09775 [Methylocella sp.]